MIPMGKEFHDAASCLVKRINLFTLTWRWHGFGMLQCDLDESLRIHIHHPALRTIPPENLRSVHDHRFYMTSAVLVGEVIDTPYAVLLGQEPADWVKPQFFKTEAFSITHAKVATGDDDLDTTNLGVAWAKEFMSSRVSAGSVYAMARRDWHTTRVDALAVTLVHRSNFDTEPARILGTGGGGIVAQRVEFEDGDAGERWLMQRKHRGDWETAPPFINEVIQEAVAAVRR